MWNLRIACTAMVVLIVACGDASELGGADTTILAPDISSTTTVTTAPSSDDSSTTTAADGSGASPPSSTATTATSAPVTTTSASTATTVQDEEMTPPSLIQAIIADLAGREGVGAGDVELISAERVEWPDGSLGCPVAGVSYIQVVTPGYRVLLGIGEETFDYRATVDGGIRLCENPLAGSSSSNPES